MSDIELIPADYAAVRQLRKLLLRLAVLIAVVIVTATGASR